MSKRWLVLIGLGLAAVAALGCVPPQPAPVPAPVPLPAPAPAPVIIPAPRPVVPVPVPYPVPYPAPRPYPPPYPPYNPYRPWGEVQQVSVRCLCSPCLCNPCRCVASQVGATTGRVAPDGTEPQIDLPANLHLKNRGGRDGAGLCVFASITHAAHWQSVKELEDFFQWMFSKPGGGYPSKVTRMVEQKCKEMGKPVPAYLQVEGSDVEILKLACRTGRMPSVTYNYSPTGRYGGRKIAHMVSLVHADDKWFGVLDNNYPGPDKIEWIEPTTFQRDYGAKSGWAVILLDAGPPPPPSAQAVYATEEQPFDEPDPSGVTRIWPLPREGYSTHKGEVTRDEAIRLLGQQPRIPDEAGKLRLTVIGSDNARVAAYAAINPVREKFVVKEYAADHWAVAASGFVVSGDPTVYVQTPTGKVLHRQGGVQGLAEALRKVDPNYRPDTDPDLRKPPVPVAPVPAPPSPLAPFDPTPYVPYTPAGLAALIALLRRPR